MSIQLTGAIALAASDFALPPRGTANLENHRISYRRVAGPSLATTRSGPLRAILPQSGCRQILEDKCPISDSPYLRFLHNNSAKYGFMLSTVIEILFLRSVSLADI
ncbi:hypothetical protein AB4Z01_01545 [Inquilinus sp. YAF38]|uniref:hypothetical protein n=1 Tax=Inquilinus sp. YAF38 TaxID=3233084 RepID=UPI003F91A755